MLTYGLGPLHLSLLEAGHDNYCDGRVFHFIETGVEELLSLYSLNYPKLQVRLASSKDARWEEKEAAILALGAVAEGCISGLLPHLAQVGFF